ncbi:MAG: hypothetical protein R3C15_10540 [Thermoleophilia bacterium]
MGGPSPIDASSTQRATEPVLAAIGGAPTVAWRENDGVNDQVRVARVNAAGTATLTAPKPKPKPR